MTEWVREDEFGNIVARGIVGEDDPYDERDQAAPSGEAKQEAEGVSTNRWVVVVVGWRWGWRA